MALLVSNHVHFNLVSLFLARFTTRRSQKGIQSVMIGSFLPEKKIRETHLPYNGFPWQVPLWTWSKFKWPFEPLNIRVLLRFEFYVPHQILYTTLATDEKLLLSCVHISFFFQIYFFSKNVVNKSWSPNLLFFKEKNGQIRLIFDLKKWLWKYGIGIRDMKAT